MLSDPYSWPPDAAEELFWLLQREPEQLGLRNALNELRRWLFVQRKWTRGDHRKHWLSLWQDVRTAIEGCGPAVRAAVPRLAELAIVAPDVVTTESLSEDEDLDVVRRSVDRVFEMLADPRVAVAAFEDLVSACENVQVTANEHDTLLVVLHDVLHIGGRPPSGTLFELRNVVTAQGLEAGTGYLAEMPPPAREIVWLGYDKATVPTTITRGNVGFFDGPALRRNVPAEIAGWELPQSPNWVAVRVNLPEGRYPDAVRTARDAADMIVTLARMKAIDSDWTAFRGFFHVGGWHQALGHSPDPWFANLLGQRIKDVDLHDTSPFWTPIVRDLEHARLAPPSAAILIDVRIIELIGRQVQTPEWSNHLTAHRRWEWAYRQIERHLLAPRNPLLGHESLQAVHNELIEIDAAIAGSSRRILPAYTAMLAVLPEHTYVRRQLAEVLDWTSTPTRLGAWLRHFAAIYEVHLRRLGRCRDGLTHSGPVDDEVVAASASFVHHEATRDLEVALRTSDADAEIRRVAAEAKARRSRFEEADTVEQALFDPPAPAARVPDQGVGENP